MSTRVNGIEHTDDGWAVIYQGNRVKWFSKRSQAWRHLSQIEQGLTPETPTTKKGLTPKPSSDKG